MRKALPSSSSSSFLKKNSNTQTMHNNNTSIPEEKNTKLDGRILSSTSTFVLNNNTNDKPEKLKKKAKHFLDERQKIKTRAQSLWSFIDATNTFDQAKFFQEHAEQVFQVVYETCMHQIEKIKHKSERPQSWNSKELVSLQKNLLLLRKIFLYIPELMRNGWQRQNIAAILTHILDHGNHLRLRALGFQLLLLWLNDQVVEYPECINLFANAISLDLFILDEIQPYMGHSASSSTTTATSANTSQAPASMQSASPSNNQDIEATPVNNVYTNKFHSTGLQFVKKLRENHSDKQIKHGLQRDEKIKTSPIQLDQHFILGDAAAAAATTTTAATATATAAVAPLYPNPVQPTYNDSIILIHIFISNLVRLAYVAAGSPPPPDEYDYPPGVHIEHDDGIATGVGIDAATASAKFLFKIFRTYYMTKFVPFVSRALQVEGTPNNSETVTGFPVCPPSILRTMLRFLIGYCLDNNSHLTNTHWQHQNHIPTSILSSSPATPILKSIVLSSHETREILHEIIRQSLVLPSSNPQYRDIIRGAIHILGVWTLGSEEERPSFLRRSGSTVTRSSSIASVSTQHIDTRASPVEETSAKQLPPPDYSDANIFLRRYLLMIKLIFDQKRPEESRDNMVAYTQQTMDWEGLVSLYKDALNLYRAIAVSKGGIDIESESWELMLQCLLEIQQGFMSQPEKYSRIPVQAYAEELADFIWETTLHAFVRAKIVHMEFWHQLKVHMVSSMRWIQSINQWVRIMQKLTQLLSSRLYKVEYDLYSDTKYRLIEELPASAMPVTNRYSMQITNMSSTTTTSRSKGSKIRSRHLSIQGRQSNKRNTSNSVSRPLSACGSDGQLIEARQQDPQPEPEGSVSTLLRNLSSASLTDFAYTFKSDRKSTNLSSVVDEEKPEEEEEETTTTPTKNLKFGIKSMMPAQQPSSAALGKRSNTSIANTSSSNEKGRRAISIQQLDTLWQDSGSKLLNLVHHGDSQASISKTANKEEDTKMIDLVDHSGSTSSSIDEISTKSNRTSSSSAWPAGESILMMVNSASVTEKLPTNLGCFKSSEFLILNNLVCDGQQVLAIWKNMLLIIGNINQIEGSQNYAIAMNCVVDIWDTLRLVRAQQPYRNIPIPSMYEIAPWLFEATELSSVYDVGKATAYGSLCRLMLQRSEETVPEGYYAAFYKSILKGLASNNNIIIQSIIINSERIFGFSLPGIHILIPSFITAIENQLLNDDVSSQVPHNVKRSCIIILGSLVSVSNHLKDITIQIDEQHMSWVHGLQLGKAFSFTDVKVRLKDIFIRLVKASTISAPQSDEEIDTYCMLFGALCALILDELLASENPQYDIIYECIVSLTNHLYWNHISIVNTAVDCLNTIAQTYKEKLDPEGIIMHESLTRILDSLNMHLKYYEKNPKNGRGFIISKLFSCLLEWIMSIEPIIFTETDLCQLVFDSIELALHLSSLTPEKRPNIHFEFINQGVHLIENDQSYVKESAEAVLLHLLHHFNSFAPPNGPATIHSTILGPGVSQEEENYHQYQYFSFNDTTIIAFVELPKSNQREAEARIIIRDLTGRYVWDTRLEPKFGSSETTTAFKKNSIGNAEEQFVLRRGLNIQSINEVPTEIGQKEETLKLNDKDPMGILLKQIGESHPDCLLDPGLPLNVPSTPTLLQMEMTGNLGSHLNDYLQNEAQNNEQHRTNVQLWYSKMNHLREKEAENGILKRGESMQTQLLANFSLGKDFLPAFPQEAEKAYSHFQQSRLLMSHMGFIHYNQLKNGSFQMLNKTPALYRDLRGLDRKHGRETIKIGLIYVAHGQEDEQTILQNNQGSERYNNFVNSLGWEIDIATHTGYLGGLERNLTNGTQATYYCSSSLEMIFHDVTKIPTDSEDSKQLKKKRHIGNDHVHIVWNEHDRDYRIGTIGGDFGNAQIIVTPLPDNLYSIQVYRDSKIPYFGPLFDQMVISQPILGSLVRATAINAFRASVHTNLYSFYKCVYAQRANDVRTITNRHKVANWSYEQFMEKIFMTEEHT
ncbi:uncharacterized protein BX663DRAFT_496797 [Cokeromyces recurvatus]|uniref:uncharacterized protein n=1 Tax=Cokeromyces recurvatus TaxID=90255 RepID=UPI0022206A20|nr:uncharacterized protein BX663DRAFT_496797 [Cokeromyces recurvatus]KAI7906537.1 hypothetical protein BX663DRAFT_496797 [Cokeromyces recurvatus]